MKAKIISLLSFCMLLFFIFAIAQKQQKSEWKGKIEYENGIKVIKNPEKPLYGEITFELEEDLRIGNEKDENYIFYKTVFPTVDALGNIFVVDTGGHRIQKFDKDGNFTESFGSRGQGPGELYYPCRIQIDNQNNIYIIGSDLKLHVFNSCGIFQRMTHTGKFLIKFVVIPEKHFIAHTMTMENKDGKRQLMNYVEVRVTSGFYLYEIEFSKYPRELLEKRPDDIFEIKNGYVYSKLYEQETDYVRILRFKIKNWDQIKDGT